MRINAKEKEHKNTKWIEFEFEGAKIAIFKDVDKDGCTHITIERGKRDVSISLWDSGNLNIHTFRTERVKLITEKEVKLDHSAWGDRK